MPGFKCRVVAPGNRFEEVLAAYGHKVRRVDQELLPDIVGVGAKLTKARGRDRLELPVLPGVDVQDLDQVYLGLAYFDDPAGQKLRTQELVKGSYMKSSMRALAVRSSGVDGP